MDAASVAIELSITAYESLRFSKDPRIFESMVETLVDRIEWPRYALDELALVKPIPPKHEKRVRKTREQLEDAVAKLRAIVEKFRSMSSFKRFFRRDKIVGELKQLQDQVDEVIRTIQIIQLDFNHRQMRELSRMESQCTNEARTTSDLKFPSLDKWMKDLSECVREMNEASTLCKKTVVRLEHVWKQSLAKLTDASAADVALGVMVSVADAFKTVMKENAAKPLIMRVAGAHSLVQKVESIHERLDAFEEKFLAISGEQQQWRERWDEDRAKMEMLLSEQCELCQYRFDWDLRDPEAKRKALMLLGNEIRGNQSDLSSLMLKVIQSVIFNISGSARSGELPSIPEWVIAREDVSIGDHLVDGGFGAVYLGKWQGSDVIIKTVEIHTADEKKMFLREADVWHKARHGNVIQFYGACPFGNPHLFVCEFARGGTLSKYLSDHPDLPRSAAWRKLLEVAAGLQFLHRKGVVHGDLKGNNILVDGNGRAKLADFGLSFFDSGSKPRLHGCGAVRWKAPECLKRDGVPGSLKADVYALAMCVIEAFTRKVPWSSLQVEVAVVHWALKGQLPLKPSELSEQQWDVVTKMCTFDPDERMTLEEAISNFERFAQEEEYEEWQAQQKARSDRQAEAS
jgi:predicted Ser/Thr protein kinase